jgi:hypothetical protein
LIDKFSLFQLVNVATGAIVALLTMFALKDDQIVTSQTIISISQISVFFLSVTVSTASLENGKMSSAKMAAFPAVLGILAWSTFFWFKSGIHEEFLISVLFFISLIIGECSSFSRARIVNTLGSRLPLVYINTFSAISRLVAFLLLITFLNALWAFLLSAAISNLVRSAALWLLALSYGSLRTGTINGSGNKEIKRISMVRKLGAFFDRNPSVIIVLVIANFSSLLGMAMDEYSLSILIMNFSITISGLMWIRHENIMPKDVWIAMHPLLTLLAFSLVALLPAIYFVPNKIVAADSLLNLRNFPILLILAPTVFGFSCGLNVFTYGSKASALKAALIGASFWAFGHYGFLISAFLNISFWAINLRLINKLQLSRSVN